MVVTSVIVVWCLLSVPVGVVLGRSIRTGMAPVPGSAVDAGAAADDAAPQVPAQRSPGVRQAQLQDAR